jgi:hypothetical protein
MNAGNRQYRNQRSLNQLNTFNQCKPHLRHLRFRSRTSLTDSSATNADKTKGLLKGPFNRPRLLRKVRRRFPEAQRNTPSSLDVQLRHPTARTARLPPRHEEITGRLQHPHQ